MQLKSFHKEDIDQMQRRTRAAFINSLSGFKSANLIGTKDSQGQTNLAIFSSCFHLGADPALLGLISRPNTVARHSLENIIETQYFTINHVNESIYNQAHQTSARYPKQISEFDQTGLTPEYLDGFQAPFVKESKIKLAMQLCEIKPIEINQTEMIVAKILSCYIPPEIIHSDGHIDIEKAQSVAVSGLDHYHLTKSIERLPYAKTSDSKS